MFETMPTPQSNKEAKKEVKKETIPPEELFGSNVFEIEKEGGLKRVSKDIEKFPVGKTEIPREIDEEAKKYAKTKSWFARTPKEANEIEEEAIKEYYEIKAKEIERIKKLEEKKRAREKLSEGKEEVIKLTEEIK